MMPSDPRKDRALALLDALRTCLENDDLDAATQELSHLTELLQEWQRGMTINAAREWLNEALHADLLSFDSSIADDYLHRWQQASASPDENPELEQFRQQVASRKQQRQDALLIRGVVAHCDELLSQAAALESGNEPPAPDFMLRHYYGKALKIARAAHADYDSNTDLERLMQRVDRLYHNKETAAAIYTIALEAHKYSNALHNLDQLPPEMNVPRFTATETAAGTTTLHYQGMVTGRAAREEITGLARTWATRLSQQAITTSQQYLDAHDPAQATDELDLGESVEKFLTDEQKTVLQQAQTQAKTQLRNRERAEERASDALRLAHDDPQAAWEAYENARTLYQWADGLEDARQTVLKALRGQLKGMVREADAAFHERRDMQRVLHLCQQARAKFSDKDASLDETLVQFDEFEDMVKRYQDYIASGQEIIERVKSHLQTDTVAANDLLSQVEAYPDFVLQAFGELYELRQRVNQRLNADHRYNQLYPALYNESAIKVGEVIEDAQNARDEFPDDPRFQQLIQWLQLHMTYLRAQQQAENGETELALQWLAAIINTPQHPDHDDAQALYQRLQTQRTSSAD